jgi:hypothetical protein
MTMNAISKLVLVVSFGLGCASAQVARPAAQVGALRGAVVVEGPAVKALPAAPGALHAYAAYEGGAIFVAPAVTGTDADCRAPGAAAQAARPSRLRADHVTAFEVRPGQVACLATARNGRFEVLWHASPSASKDVVLAAADGQ